MKILSIAGRNLASLAGEFSVDFTEPPLSLVGVFAILGATGSGKSTLLDALSLALYGQTPRSAKSGDAQVPAGDETWTAQDPRHIVRRGAPEASAVVRFEVQEVVYEATWRCQQGVRGERAGKLNPPKIELRRGDEVLANAVGAHRAKVEELTGLNFDNFCRSVLLAQGEFAAFLQAKASQRAKVLEALTDPRGVYRKLSLEAHKRGAESQGKLAQARLDVASVQVLSADEAAANAAAVATKSAEAKASAARRDAMRVEQQAWGELRKAEGVVEDARRARDDKAQAWAAEEPTRRTVGEVTEALPLREPRRRRDDAATAVAEADTELASTAQSLDAAVVEQAAHTRDLEAARAAAAQCEVEVEATREDRARARKLDDDLVKVEGDRKARGAQLADLDRDKTKLDDVGRKLDEQAARLAASEAKHRLWVDGHPAAKALADRPDAWRGPLRRYVGVRAELERAQSGLDAALAERTERETAHANAEAAVVKAEQAEADARLASDAASQLARERSSLVSVESTRALEAEKRALDELSKLGLGLIERRASLAKLRREESEAQASAAELVVARDAQPVSALEEELAQVEQRRLLAEAQASVEEHRRNLKPGEPCGVCGSVEHPWASPEAIVDADDARRACDAIKVKLDAARKAQQRALTGLAKAEAQAESAARERAKREAEVERDALAWAAAASDCGVSPIVEFEAVPAEVGALVGAVAAKLAKLGDDDRAARAAAKDETARRAALDAATATLGKARDGLGAAVRALDAAKNAAEALRTAVASATEQIAQLWSEAAGAVAGVPDARASFEADPARTLEAWDALVEGHDAARDALAAVAADAARLDAERAALTTETKVWEAKRAPLADDLAKLDATLTEARSARARLFGGTAIDEVERAQAARKATLDAAARDASARADGARDARNVLEGRHTTQQQALERARATQQAEVAAYTVALAAAGIDEAEAARRLAISDAQLEAMRERLGALERARDAAARDLTTAEQELAARVAAKPARDEAALAHDLDAEARTYEEALRDRGMYEERLAQNALRVAERDDKERLLEALQSSEGVWGELAEVIGHSAGDTLAVFAQSLSLEVLLRAANGQLRQLQPRYALRRLENASEAGLPLEIAIVDGEFGETLRPLSTLSGGEKFLVSLALALGLAQLASRNVPLGTMFIDEGFGTLDPDTLSVAMGVLDTLQQRGTKVGIISHVGDVAERIPTQVRVMKQSDGASRVTTVG